MFRFRIAAIVFAIVWGQSLTLWACPNCGRALEEHGLAAGYAVGILLMAGLPFLLLAAWALAIIISVKSAAGNNALQPVEKGV
ncbi:MAG TPA: hypothetical protein PKD54_13585 [Pirellulaceae bacterium]|nr:hypothetical protein [Pirellulaceae bacterium]